MFGVCLQNELGLFHPSLYWRTAAWLNLSRPFVFLMRRNFCKTNHETSISSCSCWVFPLYWVYGFVQFFLRKQCPIVLTWKCHKNMGTSLCFRWVFSGHRKRNFFPTNLVLFCLFWIHLKLLIFFFSSEMVFWSGTSRRDNCHSRIRLLSRFAKVSRWKTTLHIY